MKFKHNLCYAVSAGFNKDTTNGKSKCPLYVTILYDIGVILITSRLDESQIEDIEQRETTDRNKG